MAEHSYLESEEISRMLVESSPAAIMVLQDNRLVYANQYTTILTGFSKEELYSKNIKEIIQPDFHEKVREPGITPGAEISKPSHYDVTYLTKSGESRYGELLANTIHYNDKPAIIAHLIDNTDNKTAGDELRAECAALRDTLKLTQIEQNSQNIIDILPGAYYRIDIEGNILFSTPSCAALFGYPDPAILLGKNIRRLLFAYPSDYDTLLSRLQKFGEINNERAVMKRYDESLIIAEISCRFLSDETGSPVGIEGNIQDVSHTVQMEEALTESEKLLHLLENNIQDVIWTADMNMNLTYISPSVMIQRGFSQEEALNISIQDSVTPDSYSTIMKNRQEVMELLKQGKPGPDRQIMQLDFLHIDGYPVKTEVVITPAFDRDGLPVGVIGVSRDISKREKTK